MGARVRGLADAVRILVEEFGGYLRKRGVSGFVRMEGRRDPRSRRGRPGFTVQKAVHFTAAKAVRDAIVADSELAADLVVGIERLPTPVNAPSPDRSTAQGRGATPDASSETRHAFRRPARRRSEDQIGFDGLGGLRRVPESEDGGLGRTAGWLRSASPAGCAIGHGSLLEGHGSPERVILQQRSSREPVRSSATAQAASSGSLSCQGQSVARRTSST